MQVVLSVLGKVGSSLLAALLTEKVIMKLIIILLEKLQKSDKTGEAVDKAIELVREELEKRVESK